MMPETANFSQEKRRRGVWTRSGAIPGGAGLCSQDTPPTEDGIRHRSMTDRYRTPLLFFSCESIAMLLLLPLTCWGASVEATVHFERGAPPAVLVWLPQDSSWKPTVPTVIDQRFEAFIPLIAVAPPRGKVEIRNSDLQQHNVFAIDPELNVNTDLGLGAPESILILDVTWPAGSVVRHGCKIHPQMQLWVASLTSAYHAVATIPAGDADVTVRLADVPAGLDRVTLRAPRCEPLEITLDASSPILRKGKPVGSFSARLVR